MASCWWMQSTCLLDEVHDELVFCRNILSCSHESAKNDMNETTTVSADMSQIEIQARWIRTFFLLCFLFSLFTFCACSLLYIYCSFPLFYFLPIHFHPLHSSIPSFLSYSSACNGGWTSFSVTSSAHFGGQVTSFVYNRLQQDGAWGSFAFVCPRHTDPSWKSCLSSRQMWTCRQLKSCSPGLDPGVPRSRCLLCSPFHWTLIFDMRNPKINLTNMKFLCHKNTGGCYWSACAWLWPNPRVIVDFMCNKV